MAKGHFSPSTLRRFAERMGCKPEEVEERLDRSDRVSRIEEIKDKLSAILDSEMESIRADVMAGVPSTDMHAFLRFIAAQAKPAKLHTVLEPPPLTQGAHADDSPPVAATIDLSGAAKTLEEAIRRATDAELALCEADGVSEEEAEERVKLVILDTLEKLKP